MITFKPVVVSGNRRKDGTHPVKIRITYKGVSRRLPTSLTCTDADLTRGGKIKNRTVLEKADELIREMRAACSGLSVFTIETWNVDQIIAHIRETMAGDRFALDFFVFSDLYLRGFSPSTRRGYQSALNAFERFLGRRSIDINEITRRHLLDFVESVEASGKIRRTKDGYQQTDRAKIPGGVSSRYIAKLAHLFGAARDRHNDEDEGLIRIPRSPFEGLRKSYPQGRGQRNLGVEVIQKIIDHRPASETERKAFAAFVVSFGLMGPNITDLWHAKPVTGDVWIYERRKTASHRADRAEVRVRIPECLAPFLAALGASSKGDSWLPVLRRWREESVTPLVNRYLQKWAVREGIKEFTFYAARHSWASLARRLGVEKATVDEALGHVGDYRIADIYAERNWELSWAANDKVLQLFRWPKTWPPE